MRIKCDCFRYFQFFFPIKRLLFYIVFKISRSSVLYILTDGALPLPAHLLSRILSSSSFFWVAFLLYVPVTSRVVVLSKYLC